MAMQGEDLKVARRVVGWSQADLAEAIGMTRETIGAMERGQAPIEKRTELAVLYVTERAQPKADRRAENTAAAIVGQDEAATMNLAEILQGLLPELDKRYVLR